MKSFFFISTIISIFCISATSVAQVPSLPEGAQTDWVIDQPEEIVIWVLFDPITVENQLPPGLRFITAGELAVVSNSWAVDYLTNNPQKDDWGISFLEIVRMEIFTIDGVSPDWPENGAAALWFARVAPVKPDMDLGPGTPFLALEFWIPDSSYVHLMNEKGHYSTAGDVRLYRDDDERLHGSIQVEDLKVYVNCLPVGPVPGDPESAGRQVLIPPQTSETEQLDRITFAGHQVQQCEEPSSIAITGSHPLTKTVILEPVEFQFGYDLTGGAYVN